MADLLGRPEFREAIEGKRYHNPDTGNKVLFDSLPQKEQHRIYLEWYRSQRREQQREKDPKKLEEHRLKVERQNPWAVPLWDYYDRVQKLSGKKWHAPGEISTETVESLEWIGPPGDKVKIGEREFGGSTISFYRDVTPVRYVKNDEEGKIIRDDQGLATYLSEDEMRAKGLPLFDTTVTAYDGDAPIGIVADEWGATLVQVAEEHQKKGIGKFLSKLWRRAYPFKASGGFSDQGLSTFKRVYQDFVREALESGEYDRAMEEGWMTPLRFVDILGSAGLDPSGQSVGQSTITPPDLSGSDELRKMRRELQDVFKIVRRIDWEKVDFTDEEKAAYQAKFKELLQRVKGMEEQEGDQKESQKVERKRHRGELAEAYWKARQRGDEAEAKRLWDQMHEG